MGSVLLRVLTGVDGFPLPFSTSVPRDISFEMEVLGTPTSNLVLLYATSSPRIRFRTTFCKMLESYARIYPRVE